MKFLHVILSMSFLLVLPLLVVSSSLNYTSISNISTDSFISPAFNGIPLSNITRDSSFSSVLNGTLFNNITQGSSISTSLNTFSPYWISPSGNIAFGFYKLACTRPSSHCPDRYVVGIWFVKSPFKTLVWTANGDDLRNPSSIHFTNEGNLVLRVMPDNKEKRLIPDIKEPLSYGVMQDDGNLVFYNSTSEIIWQSFDHPTDTVLGGQNLRSGVDLISVGKRLHFFKGGNRLYVQDCNGLVTTTAKRSLEFGQLGKISSKSVFILSDELQGPLSNPVILSLDTTGNIYLVDSDGVRVKYVYLNKNMQQEEGGNLEEYAYIYRGTLDSRGYFNLFKERIDGNASAHESSIRLQSWTINDKMDIFVICLLTLFVFACLVLLCLLLLIICFEVVKVARRRLNKSTVAPFPSRNHA